MKNIKKADLVETAHNMNERLKDEIYANRTKSDWQYICREPVRVERINDVYYGYASELAVLRLLNHYHNHGSFKNTRVLYSENLQTWVFELDMQ